MPVLEEQDRLGDVLKFEEDNLYSREEVIVESGQLLVVGSVVARKTSTGQILAVVPGGTDGTNLPVGIIGEDVDASSASVKSFMISRHAIIAESNLIWPASATSAQIASGIGKLKDLGIVIRKSA